MGKYKTKYVDHVVAELGKFYPDLASDKLRAKAVTIFNRSHDYKSKEGYILKDTIFASSIPNSVKMFTVRERLENSEKPVMDSLSNITFNLEENRTVFDSNISIAAIELDKIEIDKDSIPKELSSSSTFNEVFNQRDDLVLLDLILVVEGVNKNGDEFIASELAENYKSIIGMPLTEEHMPQEIQGVFYDASLVEIDVLKPESEETEKKKAVRAKAVFYKHRFPDEADVLIGRAIQGKLRFSMECYFQKARCSTCGEEHESLWDYCDHLWERFDPESNTSRILVGIKFVGGSYVRHPAEDAAVLLDFEDVSEANLLAAAASEKQTLYHYAENEETHIIWKDSVSATDSDSDLRQGDESMDLKTLLAKHPELKEQLDAHIKERADEIVADMETSTEKEELEQSVTSLTSANEDLTKKVETLEAEAAKRAAIDRANAHLTELEESGMDLGSDEDKEKLIALLLKTSDDDIETLKAFLLKGAKAEEKEEESKEKEEEETEEEASDDKSDDEDESDDKEEEESDASDDDEDDSDDKEKAEAGKQLPLNGTPDDYKTAVAREYGLNLSPEAIAALAGLAKKFDEENES